MSDNSKAKTKNYAMNLPSFSEFADIREIDENFEKIDELIKANETSIGNIEIDNEKTLKEHNASETAHEDIREAIKEGLANSGINLLKRTHAYAVGDIAYSPNLPSWARLECVKAGTTADTEPDFTNVFSGGQ